VEWRGSRAPERERAGEEERERERAREGGRERERAAEGALQDKAWRTGPAKFSTKAPPVRSGSARGPGSRWAGGGRSDPLINGWQGRGRSDPDGAGDGGS
jgi:hypothetical protein